MEFTTKETAKYLGYEPITINMSRISGRLSGMEAPAHIKRGYAVFYDKDVLDEWKKQYTEKTTTKG